MEPLAGKRRRRFPSSYPPEIPGQGQAAPPGLTLQLPLFLFRHPHLDGCRSLSVGHLIRSFLAGVIGVEPLSAHSAARFWGTPGNTKAMLATPQDRVAGCRSVASFYGALDKLPFYPKVFRPLSAALSRLLPGLGSLGAIITLGRSSSCQEQKRSRYIDVPTPAGAFLSLGFLCGCLCTGRKAVFSSPTKWEF